jgi:hypothetical protein
MLSLDIVELHVATDDHNGFAKVHLNQYLGQVAQKDIDGIVAASKNVAVANLISEFQIISIEAAQPVSDPDKLKDIVRGFTKAITSWHEELDELDREMVSYHPNVLLDAHRSYSTTGWTDH